jgi:hypothetical protein
LPIGELHNQNPVFRYQPDEHDDTDLAEDVQRLVKHPEREYGPRKSQRYGDHDDERVDE